MPIIQHDEGVTPILWYNAPLDEKTKKLREAFKVDEKTGYPEHYSWRPMSRLGPVYNPEDPYVKFDPHKPEEYYSTKIASVLIASGMCAALHFWLSHFERRNWWTKPHIFFGSTAILSAASIWYQDKTLERQSIKHAIVRDYMKKYPERFGPIHRPKLREVIGIYVPIR